MNSILDYKPSSSDFGYEQFESALRNLFNTTPIAVSLQKSRSGRGPHDSVVFLGKGDDLVVAVLHFQNISMENMGDATKLTIYFRGARAIIYEYFSDAHPLLPRIRSLLKDLSRITRKAYEQLDLGSSEPKLMLTGIGSSAVKGIEIVSESINKAKRLYSNGGSSDYFRCTEKKLRFWIYGELGLMHFELSFNGAKDFQERKAYSLKVNFNNEEIVVRRSKTQPEFSQLIDKTQQSFYSLEGKKNGKTEDVEKEIWKTFLIDYKH